MEAILNSETASYAATAIHKTKSVVFERSYDERTAGSMPVWNSESVKTSPSFNTVVSSYAMPEDVLNVEMTPQQDDSFSFLDFIDMVNPLQHIPVVNYAYRAITGDEIKPIGKIIGGSVYGGPAGAVSGLVDVVVQDGTGRDMVGNVKALAGFQSDTVPEMEAYSDLPATLLAFAETPLPEALEAEESSQAEALHNRVRVAGGRTAGTVPFYA